MVAVVAGGVLEAALAREVPVRLVLVEGLAVELAKVAALAEVLGVDRRVASGWHGGGPVTFTRWANHEAHLFHREG